MVYRISKFHPSLIDAYLYCEGPSLGVCYQKAWMCEHSGRKINLMMKLNSLMTSDTSNLKGNLEGSRKPVKINYSQLKLNYKLPHV